MAFYDLIVSAIRKHKERRSVEGCYREGRIRFLPGGTSSREISKSRIGAGGACNGSTKMMDKFEKLILENAIKAREAGEWGGGIS
jgi:hypothetical protein